MEWRKSSYSGTNGQCTEVAHHGDTIVVRDSKDSDGPQLTFTLKAWAAFIHKASGRE